MDIYIHFHFLMGETWKRNGMEKLEEPSEDLQFLDLFVIIFSFQSNQCRSLWPKAWNDGISKVLWTKAPEALRTRFGGRPLEKGEER